MNATAAADELYAQHLRITGAHVDRALRDAALDGMVVHSGHPALAFQDDQHYPFRPNPWFLWLAPLADAPDSLIIWSQGARPRIVVVIPEDYWHLPPAPPAGAWASQFEMRVVGTAAEAMALLPAPSGRWAWLGEPEAPSQEWQRNPAALLRAMEQARCRKSPYEVACMELASAWAVAGHRAAARAFREGGSERAIHLAYLAASGMVDAELPYASIVALNEHAATLHYQNRDRERPAELRTLLIDAGAACRGYASDITRTLAADNGDFAALLAGMEGVQQQLAAQVRPGLDWRALHFEAHRAIADLLRDAGVLRMSGDAAVESGLSSVFLPHGLGHLLGLQVHDVGGFHASATEDISLPPEGHRSLRLTRLLEPGFVVTVEPGVYFIPMLLERLKAGELGRHVDWTLIDRLLPFGGIRIEDNVLVTADGHRNLTRAAFAAA